MGIYDRDYYQENELRPLRPWDNKSMVTLLIFANVGIFLANFLFSARNDELSIALSLRPENLWEPLRLWRLVSYGFVHADMGHIFFNMLSLYFLGRSVEDRLGKWEFFRFYMLAIVLCGIVWCVLHNDPTRNEILLGASGAVTATVMLFVFCYPNANLMLMMAIPVKAWMVGALIIIINVFSEGGGGRSSVAYDVHLVGAGFAAAYFFGGLNFGFLGTLYADGKQKLRQRKRGIKVFKPDDDRQASRDEQESDRILDKIHREGQDSLTPQERKFMERYSRRVRQRRGD